MLAPAGSLAGGTAVRRHPSAWSLWPTLGASWIAFAHALSFQGLAIWVITGCLLTALVVLPLAFAGRRLLAVVAMLGMTFVVPLLAETLGGNTSGPITRASMMAAATTGAMALILTTRNSMAVLLPSLLLLGGALGLGAAGRALWVVGLWSVAAVVTIAMMGPYRQAHLRDRRRLVPFAMVLLLVGLVAVAAVAIIAPVLGKPWTIPGSAEVAVPVATAEAVPSPSPSPSGAPSPSTSPYPSSTPSSSPSDSTPPSAEATPPPPDREAVEIEAEETSPVVSLLLWGLLILLIMLLLLLLALLLWRAWVWLLWRRLRARLSSGTPEERAVGAWTWLRLRRARVDHPLPVSASPDVAVSWASAAGEPDVVVVALVASDVAFNPGGSVSEQGADRAWRAANAGGRTPRASLRSRWRWAARTPGRAS